ncbi:MAG: hypothetical protein ACHQFZ_11090, partial [Acidimicrobiales bacterium]
PIFANLPASVGARVSFVTDTAEKLTPILTILNWSCEFGVGADGTWGLTSTNPADPRQRIDVNDPETTAGDAWVSLCGFDPQIDSVFPGEKCPFGPRHGEVLTKRVGNVTYFVDPAGQAGSAPGSGGSLATMGAAIYFGPGSTASTSPWGYGIVMGCTLTPSQRTLCRHLLANFVDHHQRSA